MKRNVAGLVVLALTGCTPAMSPELLTQYQDRTLYICCNLHVESETLYDANYYVGSLVPLGTPVQVQDAGRGFLGILADGRKINLYHRYGAQQESFQQYLDKILVADDPKSKIGSYPKAVQDAIRESRVEVGMTREQVLLSLGYPPTHRTPTITANEWTYWYNTWVTYRVMFDDTGKVSQLIGSPAPTQNKPITIDEPVKKPTAKPVRKGGTKKK